MTMPKHEPEIVRAKVAQAIEELRDGLRQMGWTEAEVRALSRTVERRAMTYALTARDDLGAD